MATGTRRRMFRRYVVFQVPGWVLALVIVAALHQWAGLAAWAALTLLLAWIAKDFALYPALRPAYEVDERTPAERLIGERGIATQPLAPRGYVRLRGELWRAETADVDRGISEGAPVEVVATCGMTLVVRDAAGGPSDAGPNARRSR